MAEGEIKKQRLDYLSANNAQKTVNPATTTELCTITLPAGVWVVFSYVVLGKSGSSTYNHTLAGRTVRGVDTNGGGTVNFVIINAGSGKTINLSVFHSITGGCNVTYAWQALKIQ